MCNSNTHYIAEYTSGRTYSSFLPACHFQQLLNNQHPLPWSRESVALSHRSSHTEASVGIIRTAEDTTPSMVIYIYISLTPFHSILFPIPPPTITPPPQSQLYHHIFLQLSLLYTHQLPLILYCNSICGQSARGFAQEFCSLQTLQLWGLAESLTSAAPSKIFPLLGQHT